MKPNKKDKEKKMKKEEFEQMMKSLARVRLLLKDEVAKDEATGTKIGELQIFIDENIDENKFEKEKGK